MKNRVISRNQISTHLPVWETATIFLLLDRYSHPSWVTGMVWTLWGLIWLGVVYSLFTTDPVKIDLDLLKREGGLKS